MARDFDLIIFDCDGTLTDSESLNNQALLDVIHEFGFTHYTIEHAYKHWVGKTISNIMLMIQMETGREVPQEVITKFIQKVSNSQTNLIPVQGAPELVAAAKTKYKICVASNGERSNVLQSLQITDLMRYFTEDQVFTKIQVKNPKPFPDLFLLAADKMDVMPERCLVIEDSESGVLAGVAAGMSVFGYAGSAHDPEKHYQHLGSAGATTVFHRLIHIQEALGL